MSRPSKISIVEVLRGLAVTAVCFAHFAKPVGTAGHFTGMFNSMEFYFKFSVHVFFVISGFVIPYSMHMSKYTIKDYLRFIAKRFLRLHPPYLIALIFTLIIAALSYNYRGLPNPETPLSVLKSLFFMHAPTTNPVFWTLKIEAQFYIFIGLFFAVLQKYPRTALLIAAPILLFLSQTDAVLYLDMLNWIPFFLIGIVGYLIYIKTENLSFEYGMMAALIAFSFIFYGFGEALAGLGTTVLMLYYKGSVNSVFSFLGEISYSLYLIHFPIGIKFINLVQRYVAPELNWLLFILAFIISLLCAWAFWRFIEKPSAKLSKMVKYVRAK
ncbi:MAG TPA: acyltransferase [Pedobacter sp.]|nr:acyltransferase [Pedobacter sp.]